MVIGYVLGVRKDCSEGAYGSVVNWLECRDHRLEDAWTRVMGSWIRATFQRSGRLVWDLGAGCLVWAPKDRYVIILVLALLYVVRVTYFACTCGVWSWGVCSISL